MSSNSNELDIDASEYSSNVKGFFVA